MEALIVVVALISLGMLAMRFGADSRPSIQSEEHRLAAGGMVWDAMSRPAPVADPQAASATVDEPMLAQVVWGAAACRVGRGPRVTVPDPCGD